eukprot:4246222-Prymnesium_polylepis.1
MAQRKKDSNGRRRGATPPTATTPRRKTREIARAEVFSPACDPLRALYSDEDMIRLLSTRFE